METCFAALSFMFANEQAREEYKSLLLDIEIEFPSKELDIISDILINFTGKGGILEDYHVAEELSKIKKYNEVTSYSLDDISEIRFKAFMDKIKGNVDTLENIPLIDFNDNKEAFLSYVNGNLRALINSEDKKKWAHWNSRAWELLTDEEAYIIYGNFINQCNFELRKSGGIYDRKAYLEIRKKIDKWNTDRNAKESLNNIRRSNSHVIDLIKYNSNQNIICSKNGTIINLNTGQINKANRNDMVLFTSKYNFMDKNISTKFMNDKLRLYKNVLGQNRLDFLLDLIAYKFLGKSLQKAIFLIGSGGTGKSLFKNMVKDLFENEVATLSYEYFTVNHQGNNDKSRDDLLVSLNNKSWGLSSEGDGDFTINQARFKTILSGSSESARPTGKTLVDVNLKRLDLLIDTNEIPRFKSMDYAISRRLLFVNFPNRIPIDKINPDYYSNEIKPNFDYVFSYFLHRAISLIGKSLTIPEVIINDTKQNIEGVDSVAKFASNRIAVMSGNCVKFEEIEKEYVKFCNSEDMPNIIPLDKAPGRKCTIFTNALKEKSGYEKIFSTRRSNGSSNNKTYVIIGVILIDSDEINPFENEEPKAIQQVLNTDPTPIDL